MELFGGQVDVGDVPPDCLAELGSSLGQGEGLGPGEVVALAADVPAT